MDPTYVFTFYKRVADSSGHCVDAEQGRVRVYAPGHPTPDAIADARRRFAAACGVDDWRYRADSMKIAPAESPRRLPDAAASRCASGKRQRRADAGDRIC